MIIIADSGSTKTDWAICKDGKVIAKLKSRGHNPNVCAAEIISFEIVTCFEEVNTQIIEEVHFYGAGLSTSSAKEVIETILQNIFINAEVNCYHDLLGAARASCGKKPGISVIMRTGSNTCVYDGQKITDNVLNSGWVLGDEGGGVNIGKRLLKSYLRQELNSIEIDLIENHIKGTASDMVKKLYEADRTNAYLASFAPIVVNNIEQPNFNKIARGSIEDLFVHYINRYPEHKSYPIHFIGSIAFYLQELVRELGNKYGASIGTFNQKPLETLIRFHS